MTTYKEIIDEYEKCRTLLPSSITVKIDNLFDGLLEYRFDKNTNRLLQHFGDQKAAEIEKTSDNYKLLHIVQQAVFNFKFWVNHLVSLYPIYTHTYISLFSLYISIFVFRSFTYFCT